MVSVKVLGTGCARCEKLHNRTQHAIAYCGVPAKLQKVEKLDDIMAYGIMMTPALVVDEVVKSSGRLPSEAQIMNWLTTAALAQES